jgi:hypothetical protein
MASNIIKINRGDSFELTVKVTDKYDSSKKYLLTPNDIIYFAILYPYQAFENALIVKGFMHTDQDIDTGNIAIKIIPNDTRLLDPGVYYYTVKLQRGGTLTDIKDLDEPDEVRTLIDRTKFIIND